MELHEDDLDLCEEAIDKNEDNDALHYDVWNSVVNRYDLQAWMRECTGRGNGDSAA